MGMELAISGAGQRSSDQAVGESARKSDVDPIQVVWTAQYSNLKEEERRLFESKTCSNLVEYLRQLEAACQKSSEESGGFAVLDWFEPLFKFVELFMPAASTAVQAYPNPGALALGGIVGIMQITGRVTRYQKMALQLLYRMGRKAHSLVEYKTGLYKDDVEIQKAAARVIGDIYAFCTKAFRFLVVKGQLRAKVKGFRLILFRDFESQLGHQAQAFEDHLSELEEKTWLCDKRRLNELLENQKNENDLAAKSHEVLSRQDKMLAKLLTCDLENVERRTRRDEVRKKARFLNQLSPLNFRTAFHRRCDDHLDGTGAWLTDLYSYQRFKSEAVSDIIWIKGKPGCGKSVLAAVAINDINLDAGPQVGLAYAFCSRDERSHQTHSTILGSLVRQIAAKIPDLASSFGSIFDSLQPNESPSPRDLAAILRLAASHLQRIFFVIDGLDECRDASGLASQLVELVHDDTIQCLKVLVFSRWDFDLEDHFKSFHKISPDKGSNLADISAYVNKLFPDDGSAAFNQELRVECNARADGMFLWVKLLAQSLHKPLNTKQKLRRIRQIPSDLKGTYDLIMNDIFELDDDMKSVAFAVFEWVTCAEIPLTSSEMIEAVADYGGARNLNEICRHSSATDLVAVCGNLVIIDSAGLFRLCHESVRAYLDGACDESSPALAEYQRRKSTCQARLSETCLKYLLLEDFDQDDAASTYGLIWPKTSNNFLEYVLEFWARHVSADAETVSSITDLVLRVVESPARRDLMVRWQLLDPNDHKSLQPRLGKTNSLHLLALHGLTKFAQALPDAKALSQEPDGNGDTPLMYALDNERQEMSSWLFHLNEKPPTLLLDSKQRLYAIHKSARLGWTSLLNDILATDSSLVNSTLPWSQHTPLTAACRGADEKVAEILIAYGAVVNLQDGRGDWPICVASRHSQTTALVRVLLDNDADPNVFDSIGYTPIILACQSLQLDAVEALLRNRADPWVESRLKGFSYGDAFLTAINVAARSDAVDIVKALCRFDGALVNQKTTDGVAPLHEAAYSKATDTVRALIELGADLNAATSTRRTAILCATRVSDLESVKALLDAGCDATTADDDGGTAIHLAADEGNLAVMRCIVKHHPPQYRKALINARDNAGQIPLSLAVNRGSTKLVVFLLDAGAEQPSEMDLKTTKYCSPLATATDKGFNSVFRPLLSQSMDPNVQDGVGNTALHYAASLGNLESMSKFFKDCDDLGLRIHLDIQDKWGKTALSYALEYGFEETARFLIQKGAGSSPDKYNSYPIYYAVKHGYESIVRSLIGHEGVAAVDTIGLTPLYIASEAGNLELVKLLLDHSRDVLDQPGPTGTPLMAALGSKHSKVAGCLLDVHADHCVTDFAGRSPLHLAARMGELPLVQRLVSLGCEGDSIDLDNATPLHGAAYGGNTAVFSAIAESIADKGFLKVSRTTRVGATCAILAASRGHLANLKKMADYHFDLNAIDHFGRSPAFVAAAIGRWKVLDWLQSRGESLSQVDKRGRTLLIAAATNGCSVTVSYLLERCPHLLDQCCTLESSTPLSCAVRAGSIATAKLLLSANADPYRRDSYGLSALDYAKCQPPLLRAMHEAGYVYRWRQSTTRKAIQQRLVVKCCETILSISPATQATSFRPKYLALLGTLRQALYCLGDSTGVFVCVMQASMSDAMEYRTCGRRHCIVCLRPFRTGDDRYLCLNHYALNITCQQCVHQYAENNDYSSTAAVTYRMRRLEKQVRAAWGPLSHLETLERVCEVVTQFDASEDWTRHVLEEYGDCMQQYDGNRGDISSLTRGRYLLQLVDRFSELRACKSCDLSEAEHVDKMQELNRLYEALLSDYSADIDIDVSVPDCKHHHHIPIRKEQLQLTPPQFTDLDPSSINRSFFEQLLDRYRMAPADQIPPLPRRGDQLRTTSHDLQKQNLSHTRLLATTNKWRTSTRKRSHSCDGSPTLPHHSRHAVPRRLRRSRSMLESLAAATFGDFYFPAFGLGTHMYWEEDGDVPEDESLPHEYLQLNVTQPPKSDAAAAKTSDSEQQCDEPNSGCAGGRAAIQTPDGDVGKSSAGANVTFRPEDSFGAPPTEDGDEDIAIAVSSHQSVAHMEFIPGGKAKQLADEELCEAYIKHYGDPGDDESNKSGMKTWVLAMNVTDCMWPGFRQDHLDDLMSHAEFERMMDEEMDLCRDDDSNFGDEDLVDFVDGNAGAGGGKTAKGRRENDSDGSDDGDSDAGGGLPEDNLDDILGV